MVQKLMWEMLLKKNKKNMGGWMDGDLLILQVYQVFGSVQKWAGPIPLTYAAHNVHKIPNITFKPSN